MEGMSAVNDAVVRSTPPLAVSVLGTQFYLSDAVYICTGVYLILQIIVIIPRVLKTIRGKSND